METPTRILGEYNSGQPGPLLVVSGGVHGNEPSGVEALVRVFEELRKNRPEIRGTVLGITGNRAALAQDVRYIDEDLNRVWTVEGVAKSTPTSQEELEMQRILSVLDDYPEDAFTKRFFLDCHTTSSATPPYISVQDVNDNDEWAHRFPTYIIRGFSDLVLGCIDRYLSRVGLTGFVFEAGQHEAPEAALNHEGMIWLAIREACGLDLQSIPASSAAVERLERTGSEGQRTFEILSRQGIEEGDAFRMEPGYSNFQPVSKGELLATLNGEELRAERDAFIFMPLYQNQGDDGFFLVEEVCGQG